MAVRYRAVIHWFRRDLRISDNPALHRASLAAERVIPAYVLSENNGGWQWSAGTGADAAPYFHDPDGIYTKRWVPELAGVPAKRLAEPPADGHPLAPGYPLPCVDHHVERERALAMFKRRREQSGR